MFLNLIQIVFFSILEIFFNFLMSARFGARLLNENLSINVSKNVDFFGWYKQVCFLLNLFTFFLVGYKVGIN